jgi:hypothetical protein
MLQEQDGACNQPGGATIQHGQATNTIARHISVGLGGYLSFGAALYLTLTAFTQSARGSQVAGSRRIANLARVRRWRH